MDDADGPFHGYGAAVLEALFTQVPLGLFLLDERLRVRRYNTAARLLRHIASERLLGRTFGELGFGFDAAVLTALAEETLRTGRPVIRRKLRSTHLAPTGRGMTVVFSMFRIDAPRGRRHWLILAVEDVTEREAARDRLVLLRDAHQLVGSTLDALTTARELAGVLVPALADTVTVHVLDEVLRGERHRPGPVVAAWPLRRAAALTVRKDGSEEGDALPETLSYPSPFTRTLQDGVPRLVARLDDELTAPGETPEYVRLLGAAGVHSLMAVPLAVPDAVLGVVAMYRYDRHVPYTRDDLELAEQIVSRAALGIDHACSYTRERDVATVLQSHLLPGRTPELTAVETAHLYLPASGGGDWFDVIELSGARVGLVVGDVAGHGIDVAATMGQLRTAVRLLAALDLEPDELLARMDEAAARLVRDARARGVAASQEAGDGVGDALATCAYGIFDPVSRRLSHASAGHPAPLLVSPSGEVTAVDCPEAGPPLGTGRGSYETGTIDLPEGTLLCLYTDGLLAGREGASQALHRVLSHPERALAETIDAVAYALADERAADDAVLLLARTHGFPDDLVATWDLPADASVVATARTLTQQQLAAWDLQQASFETELIVSELVTNAIRYADGPVRLRLIRDRSRLICEVTDDSSTSPHMRRARETDEGGRGLYLVMSLSDRWGTRHGHRGKTVWCEQSLADRSPAWSPTEPTDQQSR